MDIRTYQALTEGYTGVVDTLEKDPLPLLYAALQNRLTLQIAPVGVEGHAVAARTVQAGGEVRQERVEVPSFVFRLGAGYKGIMPVTASGFLDGDDGHGSEDNEAAFARYLALSDRERLLLKRRMTSELGKLLVCRVERILEKERLVLLNRREAVKDMAARTWQELAVGQVRPATVRRILKWGAFCDIGGVTAVLPAQELAHGRIEPAALLEEGRTYNVKVLSINSGNGRVVVSTKALLPDPWQDVPLLYKQGSVHIGTVTGAIPSGIFVELSPGVYMLAPRPAFINPGKGDRVMVRVRKLDLERRRVFGGILRLAR